MPDAKKTEKTDEKPVKKTPRHPDVFNKALIFIAAGLSAGLVFAGDLKLIPDEAARLADELDAAAPNATAVEVAVMFIYADFVCVPNRHTGVTKEDNSRAVQRALIQAQSLAPHFYFLDIAETVDAADKAPEEKSGEPSTVDAAAKPS